MEGAPSAALYTNVQAGQRVDALVVALARPRDAARAAAWFAELGAKPAPDACDAALLAVLARDALADDLAALARRHGVRAFVFAPGRRNAQLRALVQMPDDVPGTWAARGGAWARTACVFDALTWPVFARPCDQLRSDVMRTALGTLPLLAATHYGPPAARGAGFLVHFGEFSADRATAAARARHFGARVVSSAPCAGRALPEPEQCYRTRAWTGGAAWAEHLCGLRAETLVVGPLYLLAAAARFVHALAHPATATTRVEAALAALAPGAPQPPLAFLPPPTVAYWADVPEAPPAPAPPVPRPLARWAAPGEHAAPKRAAPAAPAAAAAPKRAPGLLERWATQTKPL